MWVNVIDLDVQAKLKIRTLKVRSSIFYPLDYRFLPVKIWSWNSFLFLSWVRACWCRYRHHWSSGVKRTSTICLAVLAWFLVWYHDCFSPSIQSIPPNLCMEILEYETSPSWFEKHWFQKLADRYVPDSIDTNHYIVATFNQTVLVFSILETIKSSRLPLLLTVVGRMAMVGIWIRISGNNGYIWICPTINEDTDNTGGFVQNLEVRDSPSAEFV